MIDLQEICKVLGSNLRIKVNKALDTKLNKLKGKVKKNGQPYSTEWVEDLMRLSSNVNYTHLMMNILNCLRGTDKEHGKSIHQMVGYALPREIASYPTNRFGQWVSMVLTAIMDMNLLNEGDTIVSQKWVQCGNGDMVEKTIKTRTFYLNYKALHNADLGEVTALIKKPNSEARRTNRVLGSIWVKDSTKLNHNEKIIDLINGVALTFNQEVLAKMNYEFPLDEPNPDDWDSSKFPKYEDWVADREEQHRGYIGKLPKTIEEMGDEVFYNTYAPDSRGRLYPTNDAANFVGIKYVRAIVQFADDCIVDVEE